MSDRNYISITGDAAGNIWLNGELRFTPETPLEERILRFEGDLTPPALGPGEQPWADTLKFSGVRRLKVYVTGRITGGTEDCIDINNRCEDLEIVAGSLLPLGKYAITCKGESRRIRVRTQIMQRAKEAEVDLGNHSDQAKGRTTEVQLDLTAPFRIRTRVLHAWRPSMINPNTPHGHEVQDEARGIFAFLWAILKALKLA